METAQRPSLLDVILVRLSPADIAHTDNRRLIAERIESLLRQNSWSRQHFTGLMRREILPLRTWLGHTYSLTLDGLHELCALLHVSLGDLVAE